MNTEINIKYWYKINDYGDIKYMILLILSALHHDKKITDAKLKGQFKALHAGTLQKAKITHHCEITDRWYNSDPVREIFQDVIELKGVNKIPFDVFIKYIMLFENKGYNHAINTFGTQYIYPLFTRWNPEYHDYDFSMYIQFKIDNIRAYVNSYNCYECGSSHSTIDKQESDNSNKLNEWLHRQKKGNKMRIPRCDIRTGISVSQYGFDSKKIKV